MIREPQFACKWLEDVDIDVTYLDNYKSSGEDAFSIALRSFKDGNNLLGERLASDMVHMVETAFGGKAINCVVPIIGHNERSRDAKSPLGAAAIAVAGAIPCRTDFSLVSKMPHAPLHGTRRTKAERRRLVAESSLQVATCDGLQVLLLDDVLTTGASLEAYARVLRSAGASVVGAAVIGRHDRDNARAPINPGRYARILDRDTFWCLADL
jgi:predicted amidophosphoribosyltransferase